MPNDPFLAAARLSLSCRDVAVLNALVAEPGLSTKAYACTLELSKPVVTRATMSLVDSGLARSAQDAQDRRRVILTPTAKGQKLSASLLQVAS